jgi:hypothetical protein
VLDRYESAPAQTLGGAKNAQETAAATRKEKEKNGPPQKDGPSNEGARVSAASAVLADGFIHQGVKLGASQGDFVGGINTAVGGFGKFGATAGWRSDVIAGSSGHKLGDFARGEQLGFTGEASGKSDLREVLDGLQAEEGGDEIRAASNRAVIGKEERVVVRHIRFKDGAEIGSAGSGVADERNFAEADHDFRKKRLVEPLTSGGESGGRGRMSVANGLNVGAHAIEEEVHSRFGGDLAVTLEVASLHIHDDEILGRHHALVEASGSGEDAVSVEANGNISFAGDDMAAFIHPAADHADVATVLFFRTGLEMR